MPFLGEMLRVEVGEEGPHASPRCPADPAPGRVTARTPPLGTARGGCRAKGLFSGPLLRLPVAVTVNSLEGALGCRLEAAAGSVLLRGQDRCEKQVLFCL